MINLFQKSRRIKVYGCILIGIIGIIYAFSIMLQTGFSARLISPLVLLVLGISICYFIAFFAAVVLHQKILQILYNDVDPTKFIAAYEPLLTQKHISATHLLTLKAHLANAYANSGEIERAVLLIREAKLPAGRFLANAKALIAGNLCSYYLLEENTTMAQSALNELSSVIEAAKSSGHSLSSSYIHNAALQHIHLDFLLGRPVDEALLYKELENSSNMLHKANIFYLLGRISLAKGFHESADYQLKKAARYSDHIIAGRKAALLLGALDGQAHQ